MAWRKIYLFILAVLLILLTVLLSAAAVRIWQEGSARKAENPLAAVYTPENVAAALHRISPLIYTVIGMATAGLLLGIRDEKSTRPVPVQNAGKGGPQAPAAAGKQSGRGTAAARIILLLAAGVFIVLGVLNGSMEDVLRKAINLCTECIGLG